MFGPFMPGTCTVPSDLYLVVKGPGVVFALVLYLGAIEMDSYEWI